jgi:nucleoside-diphosphate-sugar epimerase
MFAITGITGNVGGEVARNLLAAGQPVRAVVRDLTKGETWSESGCSLAAADIGDAVAMTAALPRIQMLDGFQRRVDRVRGWSSRLPQRKCGNGNCVANAHRTRT